MLKTPVPLRVHLAGPPMCPPGRSLYVSTWPDLLRSIAASGEASTTQPVAW